MSPAPNKYSRITRETFIAIDHDHIGARIERALT